MFENITPSIEMLVDISLIGAVVAGVTTLVTNGDYHENGWDLAWHVYRNALLGSVWYVSVPVSQLCTRGDSSIKNRK